MKYNSHTHTRTSMRCVAMDSMKQQKLGTYSQGREGGIEGESAPEGGNEKAKTECAKKRKKRKPARCSCASKTNV